MKKVLATAITAAFLLSTFTLPATAAVKAGATCSKAGITNTSAGKKFTCVKSGKKLVWNQGIVVTTPNSQKSSQTLSVPVIPDPTLSAKTIFENVESCKLKSTLTREANLGYGISTTYVKSTGQVNLAIIYTTYTDAAGDDRAFNEYDKVQFPNVAKFYSAASYGKLTMSLIANDKYYPIGKSSASYNLEAMDRTSNFSGVISDAVNAAKSDYDFSKVDAILVIMPSTAKAVDLGASGVNIQIAGKTFYNGVSAAYINPSSKMPVMPLFLVHELGHNFGLPHPLRHEIGYAWDVMNWEEVPAPDLFGWEKFILSWIDSNQVDCLTTIPSAPVTEYLESTGVASANTKLLVKKISDSEVLVVESRRKNELDNLTLDEEGVLIYKVNVNLGSDKGAIAPINNGSPSHKTSGQSLLVGTLQQGESLSAEGIKITVIKKTASGDFISVSKAD